MMIKQLISLLILMVFTVTLNAQDNLLAKGTLKESPLINDIKISDSTAQVATIIDNVITKKIFSQGNNPKLKKTERKKAIKIDLVGPFRGFTQISYEQATRLGRSFEVGLGIIGLGKNGRFQYPDTINYKGENHQNQHGFFLSAGYKFNKLHVFQTEKATSIPFLQGAYAKPIFYFGEYSENRVEYFGNREYGLTKPKTTFIALEVEFGKEWVFRNRWPVDIYWGVGYAVDNKQYYNTSYYDYTTTTAFNYCNDRLGKSPGISFTFGIKTGLLFR